MTTSSTATRFETSGQGGERFRLGAVASVVPIDPESVGIIDNQPSRVLGVDIHDAYVSGYTLEEQATVRQNEIIADGAARQRREAG